MKQSSQLALGVFGPPKELKARMQKLAVDMLMSAGESGVGFDEVRHAAETRGWLTGRESGRFLSFGASMMAAAGGVAVRYRRSRHAASQRRRVAVYVHKSYIPVDATVAGRSL